MKKILLMIVFSTLAFSQTYNMQIQIGVKDGVKVADYEKAMIQHIRHMQQILVLQPLTKLSMVQMQEIILECQNLYLLQQI